MKPGEPVSHNDASVLLRAIQRKLGVRLITREMPSAPRQIRHRQADCERAMRMIEGEMLASLARCAALERDM